MHNQDFRGDPAWVYKLREIIHGSVGFRALASSPVVKGPDMRFPSGVGTFYGSDTCLLTSLVDLRLTVLCASILACCEAMEFDETGHRRNECPHLPVSLLIALHALRLECEKSMEWAVSSQCFCSFGITAKIETKRLCENQSRWCSEEGAIKGLALSVPACHVVLANAT